MYLNPEFHRVVMHVGRAASKHWLSFLKIRQCKFLALALSRFQFSIVQLARARMLATHPRQHVREIARVGRMMGREIG